MDRKIVNKVKNVTHSHEQSLKSMTSILKHWRANDEEEVEEEETLAQ